MARPLRIEYPGAYYHVYHRGIERRKIYQSAKDYALFQHLLEQSSTQFNFIIHAYCLMSNHYHLKFRRRYYRCQAKTVSVALTVTPLFFKAGFSKAVDFFNGVFDRSSQEILINAGNGSIENTIFENSTLTASGISGSYGDLSWEYDEALGRLTLREGADTKIIEGLQGDNLGMNGKITISKKITDEIYMLQEINDGKGEFVEFYEKTNAEDISNIADETANNLILSGPLGAMVNITDVVDVAGGHELVGTIGAPSLGAELGVLANEYGEEIGEALFDEIKEWNDIVPVRIFAGPSGGMSAGNIALNARIGVEQKSNSLPNLVAGIGLKQDDAEIFGGRLKYNPFTQQYDFSHATNLKLFRFRWNEFLENPSIGVDVPLNGLISVGFRLNVAGFIEKIAGNDE